jgi:chromodomain-helicase-DNA-binding protein 1
VTLFWPKKVKATKLEEIHAKMVMKEAGDSNLKKPRLSAGVAVKTNGSASVPASSIKSNSKSYR